MSRRSSGRFSAAGSRRRPADTIFFGGGTPSLLEPDEIGTADRRLSHGL